jgi:hypothetical protein
LISYIPLPFAFSPFGWKALATLYLLGHVNEKIKKTLVFYIAGNLAGSFKVTSVEKCALAYLWGSN